MLLLISFALLLVVAVFRFGAWRALLAVGAPVVSVWLVVNGHVVAGGVLAGWLALFWLAFGVARYGELKHAAGR